MIARAVSEDEIVARLRAAASHLRPADQARLEQAVELARAAHAGQRRDSGEPYLVHPVAVAETCLGYGLDADTVIAAVLHDVVEDTEVDLASIEEAFGERVARLVDGVTKLSRVADAPRERADAESVRKMFLAMAADVAVVFIKLADRLHNLRTLEGIADPARRRRIAAQTLEIYAPLAERIGLYEAKWELEDLAFKALEPERFAALKASVELRRRHREAYVKRAAEALAPALAEAGIDAQISGRAKHLYSIHSKMIRKGIDFEEVYDVHALRVVVPEIRDCYGALGVVHHLWKPIPGQFDDYIAVPKNNLYQSLHTAVIALDGKPLEVQIRTPAMHAVSELGIAAHWRYKDGSRSDRAYDEKLAWLRSLLDWQHGVEDATEFVEGLALDVFADQVFVFTPKGEVKELPAGATPLDFAYRIHTNVGHRTIGAKVNNRLVPLDHALGNGDIVEILTTKAEHGPSRDWLTVVRTAHAREKIRAYFRRAERADNIIAGRAALDRELRRLARTTVAALPPGRLAELVHLGRCTTTEDLFATIGYGGLSAEKLVARLGLHDDTGRSLPTTAPPPSREHPSGGVAVSGVGDLLSALAGCCSPLVGDPIAGFVSRGRGVIIHRADCVSLAAERERERIVSVAWQADAAASHPVAVVALGNDRPGLLNDVTTAISAERVNILAAAAGMDPGGGARLTLTLSVSSARQLGDVLGRIERVPGIERVWRAGVEPAED